jgi:serine/threonine-protein kinase RsbW
MEISFESRLEHVSLAGVALRAMCESRGADALTANAVELAAVEAANNVVEHAYDADCAGPVRIVVRFEEDAVDVEVADLGRGVPPEQLANAALPEIGSELDDLPEGGFGLALLRALTDEVATGVRDGWNILRFRRSLAPRVTS